MATYFALAGEARVNLIRNDSPRARKSPIYFLPQSPSPRDSPISVGLRSTIQNKSGSVRFLGPSPRKGGGSDLLFGPGSPSPRKSPICFRHREPESKGESDYFFTPEPESKGESDCRWTYEPDGLKSPIQNKTDSVRFLGSSASASPGAAYLCAVLPVLDTAPAAANN
jgi:hypothetical protein